MDFDYKILASIFGALLFSGLVIQNVNIRVAHKFGLLDAPTARRRHKMSVPVTGGLGVFITWFFGLAALGLLQPAWAHQNLLSLVVIAASVVTLVAMGLVDDLKGLSPFWKLAVEVFVASGVIAFEPRVHQICEIWSQHLGIFVWPVAALWIVTVTNAINLIDGLDGLAGGMSVLVGTSIMVLSVWTGDPAALATALVGMLIPSLLSFLRYNWAPAKIFLGDNGSLPIGFLLATTSLMCRPTNKSWIMLASLIIMLGYPILDMGLAVWRRWVKGQPLFKADRNHLHFRVLRLGPTTAQAAFLLLSIGLYLQILAVCINLTNQATAAMGLSLAVFSISSLLFLVRSIERWRVKRLFANAINDSKEELNRNSRRTQYAIRIDLEPFLESAMLEEQKRYKQLLRALELMISTMARVSDSIFLSNQELRVVLGDAIETDEDKALTLNRYREKLVLFLELYNLQCSLASMPIRLEEVSIARAAGEWHKAEVQTVSKAA